MSCDWTLGLVGWFRSESFCFWFCQKSALYKEKRGLSVFPRLGAQKDGDGVADYCGLTGRE